MVINRKPLAVARGRRARGRPCRLWRWHHQRQQGQRLHATGKKGGTLYYLTFRPTEHLDPQRTYIGRDISNFDRLAYRGLVTYPITTDTKKGTTPVPDLATDTGTSRARTPRPGPSRSRTASSGRTARTSPVRT